MLNFCHFQIHDLMKVKATELGMPITPIVSGLDPGLTAAPNLASDVLAKGKAWVPPIIQQLPGGLLVVERSLDYRN